MILRVPSIPDGVSRWVIGEEVATFRQHPAELGVVFIGDRRPANLPVRGHEALSDVFEETKGDPPPKRLQSAEATGGDDRHVYQRS